MEKIVNIDKEQLLSLLRQYRELITEHLSLTNKTIEFSQQIQQLLIALEKYEDDFAAKVPNEDMKFRDSLRQIHKLLKNYFEPKKTKLAKHFHGLTQQVQNVIEYVQILDHHVAKASRVLKAQASENLQEDQEYIVKNVEKLARAEQACRAGYECIKLEVNEAQRLMHELHHEISPPKSEPEKKELDVKLKETKKKKVGPELLLQHIIKHTPDFMSTVEKAEIQDHLINYLERLELQHAEAYLDEEYQHELVHLVNENRHKSKALQFELNMWLKKQKELELQMQKVYAPETQVRRPSVFSLSMDPSAHFRPQ